MERDKNDLMESLEEYTQEFFRGMRDILIKSNHGLSAQKEAGIAVLITLQTVYASLKGYKNNFDSADKEVIEGLNFLIKEIEGFKTHFEQ